MSLGEEKASSFDDKHFLDVSEFIKGYNKQSLVDNPGGGGGTQVHRGAAP